MPIEISERTYVETIYYSYFEDAKKIAWAAVDLFSERNEFHAIIGNFRIDDEELRDRGYGRKLYENLEEKLRLKGVRSFSLHSMFDVKGFWRKMGYTIDPKDEREAMPAMTKVV